MKNNPSSEKTVLIFIFLSSFCSIRTKVSKELFRRIIQFDKDKTKRTAKIKAKVNSTASRLINGTLEVSICNFNILIIAPTIPL